MGNNYYYFDYAASTPIDNRVVEAMNEAQMLPGNASSIHAHGRKLRFLIDRSRRQVADFFGTRPEQVTFTSGATEAISLGIIGWWRNERNKGRLPVEAEILFSEIEHPAVTEAIGVLEAEGAIIRHIPIDGGGKLDLVSLEKMIGGQTALVICQWVNNITGTRQSIEVVGEMIREERRRRGESGKSIEFFCDAVQAVRFEEIMPEDVGIGLMAISGHKAYGPKGVGILWRRLGVEVEPLMRGGGQENGRRGGTENVTGIVGLGRALELISSEREEDAERFVRLAATMEDFLSKSVSWKVVGRNRAAAPGIWFLRHARLLGSEIALRLDVAGFSVSVGSACASGKHQAPPLLKAVLGEQDANRGGVRISFGRFTEKDDLLTLLEKLPK